MTVDNGPKLTPIELRQRLNLETGQLSWDELQRYFAQGVVLVVEKGLDLVDVAASFAEDNRESIEILLHSQQLHQATDSEARNWHDSKARFWAVVVAPWVIIQQIVDD
ncbi:MAG: DUF2288 domain-containing protein [Proteobacteria bacterium]|jgi:hypothetical protein|nr:DUF2288 domain-containing protein [Pseudomonadota bacterium]